MKCKLCLQDKKLARESHIIPQLMYRDLLEDSGFYYKLDKHNLKKYSQGKTLKEFITGEYDSDILCSDCEINVLCKRYEDYAAKVFQLLNSNLNSFDNIQIEIFENANGIRGKRLQNIQYATFKLFLLSILWRASISKRPFFSQVSLGSQHENSIRSMIYDSNPRNVDDYPCVVHNLRNNDPELEGILEGTIARPNKIKRDGNTSYMFMISGLMYTFTISKYNVHPIGLDGAINHENTMIIWDWPDDVVKSYLFDFKQRLEQLKKK